MGMAGKCPANAALQGGELHYIPSLTRLPQLPAGSQA